jgi:hypothetical protein
MGIAEGRVRHEEPLLLENPAAEFVWSEFVELVARSLRRWGGEVVGW